MKKGKKNNRYHIPLGIFFNWFRNVLKMGLDIDGYLYPYFTTYYVTLRCNFSCKFCDDGSKTKYPDIHHDELSSENALKLLDIIKKDCPSIYFTGGEPTLRNDIVQLCKHSRKIGFSPVSINTNGSLLRKREKMLDHIDQLVISLNTLDLDKYSDLVGVNRRLVEQTYENILRYSKAQTTRSYKITINCVVNKETIKDVPDLMDFCFDNQISFSLVPRITGNYPDDGLLDNFEWERLVDYVINQKKQGRPVFNSFVFLNYIKKFKKYDCNPTIVPHVYPKGNLLFPCQKLKFASINLLEIGSYKKAANLSRKQINTHPKCDNRCHLACYFESSMITNMPLTYFNY